MQLELSQIAEEQQQLQALNAQLQARASKFQSEFTPLTLTDYKLFKIQKARQTGNIKYLNEILLEDIEDLQERKNKILERANKFFQNVEVQSDPNKFFNQRTTPDFTSDSTAIRYDTWYLFGVDYMSNQKIRSYFSVCPNFRIEWINDSSCNLQFENRQLAEQAIKPYIQGQSMKDEKNQIWYELQPYEVEGIKRKLFCRLATNKDVKNKAQHGHNSKYYRWEINKQKINHYVKKRADREMTKTKRIKNYNVKNKKVVVKKQEEDSSSGVDSCVEQ